MTKRFQIKDVFFNNGIVNLYQFLNKHSFNLTFSLSTDTLSINVDDLSEKIVYDKILSSFLEEFKIVHQTKNNRLYFDGDGKDFVLDKKFNTRGGQRNDVRNGIYIYGKVSDFGLSKEEIKGKYRDACDKYGIKPEDKEIQEKLVMLMTLKEATERFAQYLVGGPDTLQLDSKIHSFEDGQNYFHDMLKQSKSYKIDKWDALIYWFGCRVGRFYGLSYFIYPNSVNLEALNTFKEKLKIRDDKATVELKEINTNIDFYSVLQRDEITNKYFYISRSMEEFEFKLFMYIFSYFYHAEERYESGRESSIQSRARIEELYNSLEFISFVIYTEDDSFKTSLNEYTKAYQLISFFDKLKYRNLFRCLGSILEAFSLSCNNGELNTSLTRWCRNILNFSSLRKEYYLTSFNILKNSSKGFGRHLYEFEKTYLNYILRGYSMNIHDESKKLGDGIGHFCAELGNKDLLFKLRNVKNYKQLVSYFKDLKFSSLKHEEKDRFSKDFNESLNNLLEHVEQDWEIARDYIAIYAIDKFKVVNFATNSTEAR